MFSIFKSKPKAVPTTVHPDVGAPLVRGTTFPSDPPPEPTTALTCRTLHLEGVPPQGRLLPEPIRGETATTPVIFGGPQPLALVTLSDENSSIEVWQLESNEQPRFVRKLAGKLDPEQGTWAGHILNDAACLPSNRALLSVSYYDPYVKQALYLYDVGTNAYSKLADVDFAAGNPTNFFTALPLGAQATIVVYYEGVVRTGTELYYNLADHLVLFTPRYPQGLEVLRLGAADGTVQRWTLVGRTLWLATTDKRDPKKSIDLVWSLDLNKVLPP